MKNLRKISAIIVLAVVLTIGSVFAAWHYSIKDVNLELTRSATMAAIESDTAKGTVSVLTNESGEQVNSLVFLVDDTGDIDWVAALVPSGSVTIKFVASETAEPDVRENGVKLQATVTVEGLVDASTNTEIAPTKYTADDGSSVAIFSVATTNTFEIGQVANGGTAVINASAIANCLVFNENKTVILDTYQENKAYESAMKTYLIVITITEVAA